MAVAPTIASRTLQKKQQAHAPVLISYGSTSTKGEEGLQVSQDQCSWAQAAFFFLTCQN